MEITLKEELVRTAMLIGEAAVERLSQMRVAIFGIGGVGGYVVEALARSGIGSFVLIDNDTVSASNINRQIIATTETIGRDKTEVMTERILSINPDAEVLSYNVFYLPENSDSIDISGCNYIVDAVDTISAKIEIILKAKELGIPVISCMGAGNKLDPAAFRVADIYDTSVCPLAKVMRRELKKREVDKLKVVYSTEKPVSCGELGRIPASIAFTPAAAGLIIASEAIKDMAGI